MIFKFNTKIITPAGPSELAKWPFVVVWADGGPRRWCGWAQRPRANGRHNPHCQHLQSTYSPGVEVTPGAGLFWISYASEHNAGLPVVGRGDEDATEHLGRAGHPGGAGWKLPKQLRVPRRLPEAGSHGVWKDARAVQGADQKPQEAVLVGEGGQSAE